MTDQTNTSWALINGIQFPMSAGTMIGKAWQLYLYNFKEFKYYFLLPIICFILFEGTDIYLSVMGYNNPFEAMLLWFGLFLLIVYVSSMIIYTRGFYSLLVGKNTSFSAIIDLFKKQKVMFSLLVISISFHIVAYPFLIIVLGLLVMMVFSLMLLVYNSFLVVVIFIILTVIILFFVREVVDTFLFIPVQIVLTVIDKKKFKESVYYSRQFIKDCKPKSFYLGVLLVVFIFFLIIWPYLISILMINIITSVLTANIGILVFLFLSGIVNLSVFGPLVCGSVVLMYLDYKSQNEGIDLVYAIETECIKLKYKDQNE